MVITREVKRVRGIDVLRRCPRYDSTTPFFEESSEDHDVYSLYKTRKYLYGRENRVSYMRRIRKVHRSHVKVIEYLIYKLYQRFENKFIPLNFNSFHSPNSIYSNLFTDISLQKFSFVLPKKDWSAFEMEISKILLQSKNILFKGTHNLLDIEVYIEKDSGPGINILPLFFSKQ